MDTILIVQAGILLLLSWLAIRNRLVSRQELRLLNEEYEYLGTCILRGDHPEIRYRRHEALPSYYTRVFMFWIPLSHYHRPLQSFYPEDNTIEEGK